MKLSLLIARRFLRSKKSLSVINTTATVSSVAMGVAVAAMVLLLSVQNGFQEVSEERFGITEADIVITPARGKTFSVAGDEWAQMREGIDSVEGVGASALYLKESVAVEYDNRRTFATLYGVNDDYLDVVRLTEPGFIWYGKWQLCRGDYRYAVVGRSVDELFADGYSVKNPSLHGRLRLYAARRESFSPLLPMAAFNSVDVKHAATLSHDATEHSESIFVAMDVAEELLSSTKRASGLAIRVAEGESVERTQEVLREVVGEGFVVQNRFELNGAYVVMEYEKWAIFFILLLVTIIAAASIIGSIVMLIIEKRNDIYTLYAIGADHKLIRRIFSLEGVLIGLRGVVGGVAAGVAVCLAQIHLGLVKMPGTTFLIENYPVKVIFADIIFIALAVVAVVYVITRFTVAKMVPKTTKPDETRN